MNEPTEAREALGAISGARQTFPAGMKYPVIYDAYYGATCGLLVAGQGLQAPWSFIALAVSLAGLAALIQWWRRKAGWWVSGYSPKRARWVALGMFAVFLVLIGVSIWGKSAGIAWMPVITGLTGFITAVVGSRLWNWVWHKELKETGE